MLLWNNCLITSRKKIFFFLHKWFERNIYFVMDLFDENGNVLSYEAFMFTYVQFPHSSERVSASCKNNSTC